MKRYLIYTLGCCCSKSRMASMIQYEVSGILAYYDCDKNMID